MDLLTFFDFLKDKKTAHYFLICLVAVFLLFTAVVYFLPTTVIDLEFSEEIQEGSSPFLDAAMKGVSWFGVTRVAVFLVFGAALIFFIFQYRTEALFVILTLTISLINFGIKILINRPRPTEDLVTIIEKAQHQSFPSGHTSFYVVYFGFLVFLMLRHRHFPKVLRYFFTICSLLLIFSIPFSRIYLGAHWFTDVAAGFILGVLVLYLLIMLYLKSAHKETLKRAR